MRFTLILLAVATLCLIGACSKSVETRQPLPPRPNILLIVADDMGYSDLGVYGSEIATPTLDALAQSGVQFTNFYSSSLCSPARAMLLSGVDNHIAGLGNMVEGMTANQEGQPGHEGFLNERVISISELLQGAGYHTYMAGKWHLGTEPDHWPDTRGFDRSFALLEGASHHFDNRGFMPRYPMVNYVRDGASIDLPEDFFSTQSYTDAVIENIEQHRDDEKPFFAYLAYTAPHWPLQVSDDYLDLYAGKYDAGYEATRAARMQKLKQLGIVASDFKTGDSVGDFFRWQALSDEERRTSARKMELYAAMVENLDHHVERLFDYLRATNQFDNTLIIFMSDNGASNTTATGAWTRENFDTSYESMGKKGSFVAYGLEWAQVSNTPYRGYKAHHTEGGMRVPLIVKLPQVVSDKKRMKRALVTVRDIAPTILEFAQATLPLLNSTEGKAAFSGKSLVAVLDDDLDSVHSSSETFAWEVYGRRAVRQSNWKIVWSTPPVGVDGWQLYDLDADPGEHSDVAEDEPVVLEDLKALWDEYATRIGVVLPIFE